ncbi:MAG TPA: di-heme oxidoredictase family protein, partial [Anaeromyxobacter sp.]
ATGDARRGSELFDRAGCATCHVRTLVTAPVGTKLNGGTFVVPPALGDKAFHPFGDFLMHDVATGDGIVVAVPEHHGRSHVRMQPTLEPTANRIRTAPLWGLRTRDRLMHDGQSLTPREAVLRHGGEAEDARRRFERLGAHEQEQLLVFLRSL